MSFIDELKRRNVVRVGIAYLVASWLLLQVIDVIGPILHLPETFARYALFLLVIGLIPALVLAWVLEWTPQGVRRERKTAAAGPPRSTRTLDRAIMATLALAVALLLFDRFRAPQPGEPVVAAAPAGPPKVAPENPAPAATGQNSVAVLPFVPMSNGPDDDYFADGLSEEIINALGQVPDLLVTARTSAFHFRNSDQPVADIARELGVAHIVEGSVRRAGEQLRISTQLIRASDGFQLWSETYDRRTEDTFAVQSDIAEKVAQALNVLLDENLRAQMRRVGTRNVEAFIALQKGIELYERAHQEENRISLLRQANVEFEHAIERAPTLYPAYEYHADLYIHELFNNASGVLDGEITDADLATAPDELRHDFDQAIRKARTPEERHSSLFGYSLLFGPWRGLSMLYEQAAAATDCEAPAWLPLAGAAFGRAEAALAAFSRMAACDPLRATPFPQMSLLNLWLGRPAEAIRLANSVLERSDDTFTQRLLTQGMALSGDVAGAERFAMRNIREEDELMLARALVAAIHGDGSASLQYQEAYLGTQGPQDGHVLVLEALRGNRNEANRLAGVIDSRPFGYILLLNDIYTCLCGAPFDLEAAPNFAALLSESGLDWPPSRPYDLPLKSW